MLLTSSASLNSLNQILTDELDVNPVPMNRFRPNIVVAGDDLEAFDEDYWRRIKIGEMFAYVVRPCKRCAIPYVDQSTGKKTGKVVGKALAETRLGSDRTKPNDTSR